MRFSVNNTKFRVTLWLPYEGSHRCLSTGAPFLPCRRAIVSPESELLIGICLEPHERSIRPLAFLSLKPHYSLCVVRWFRLTKARSAGNAW